MDLRTLGKQIWISAGVSLLRLAGLKTAARGMSSEWMVAFCLSLFTIIMIAISSPTASKAPSTPISTIMKLVLVWLMQLTVRVTGQELLLMMPMAMLQLLLVKYRVQVSPFVKSQLPSPAVAGRQFTIPASSANCKSYWKKMLTPGAILATLISTTLLMASLTEEQEQGLRERVLVDPALIWYSWMLQQTPQDEVEQEEQQVVELQKLGVGHWVRTEESSSTRRLQQGVCQLSKLSRQMCRVEPSPGLGSQALCALPVTSPSQSQFTAALGSKWIQSSRFSEGVVLALQRRARAAEKEGESVKLRSMQGSEVETVQGQYTRDDYAG